MNAALQRRWQRLAARIDGMSPRERLLTLAAAGAALVFVAQVAVLGPLARKQDVLRAQALQQRDALTLANDAIAKQIADYGRDPNQPLRERLAAVRADTARRENELRTMEKGLVPAERIAPLLEAMLRANGRLALVSLRTLPVDTIDGAQDAATRLPASPASPAPAAPVQTALGADPATPPHGAGTVLYRHGVELTMRGSYLDMVDAMHALETLPTQLFWGRAQLDAQNYPDVRLTLTLYTLSLDPKWMKL